MTEHRLVGARAWKGEGMGSNCLRNTGFPFGMMKMFWRWRLHNIVNVLNYRLIVHVKMVDLCCTQLTVISFLSGKKEAERGGVMPYEEASSLPCWF